MRTGDGRYIVVRIHPEGLVYKFGNIQVGDEIRQIDSHICIGKTPDVVQLFLVWK